MGEHLLQLPAVRLHVMIIRVVPVSRPGPLGIGSAGLSENDDLPVHENLLPDGDKEFIQETPSIRQKASAYVRHTLR